MHVTRTAPATFVAAFESEEELRREHETNLAFNALSLATAEGEPLHSIVQVTLRGPWGGEVSARGTVVAALPNGIALAIEGDPGAMLERLLLRLPLESVPVAAADEGEPREGAGSSWDRIRGLSQTEKILLAVKADRTERAMLLQDNDPRVLLSLLRNPRLTIDEVARVAKSPFLTYQLADVIMQSAPWMGSLDVRLALVRNAKTPQAFALRILPTLPDAEVRAIARGGTSMALKQAALRRLQGK